MLENTIVALGQVLLILVGLTIAVCLIAIIFAVLSGIKQIHNENKIKDQTLKDLRENFNELLKSLDKEK